MACCPRVPDLITFLLAVGIVNCCDGTQTPTQFLGTTLRYFKSCLLAIELLQTRFVEFQEDFKESLFL